MNTKRNIGNEIIQSMEDAVEYMRGKKTRAVTHKVKIPDNINVKSIRKSLKLTRLAFADRYGFSSRTLQHWEQGDRRPQGAARILLVLLQREPEIIEKILNPESKNYTTKRTIANAQAVSHIRSQKVTHKRKTE